MSNSADTADFSSYVGENGEGSYEVLLPFLSRAAVSLTPSLPVNEMLRKGIKLIPSARSRKEQLGAPG